MDPVRWTLLTLYALLLGPAGVRADSCEKVSAALQLRVQACQIEVSTLNCAAFAKEHGLAMEQLRTCKPCELSGQNLLHDEATGGWQAAKEVAQEYQELVTGFWQQMQDSQEQRQRFFATCDESLACKRGLMREHPRYKQMSDAELMRFKTMHLWSDLQTFKGLANQTLRQARPSSRLELAEAGEESSLQPRPSLTQQALGEGLMGWLNDQGTKYQCLKPQYQAQLRYYALLMIIDPLAALKVVKKIPWLGKLFKSDAEALAKFERRGRISEDVATGRRSAEREAFVSNYERRDVTSTAENWRWIMSARQPPHPNRLFVDVENSKLKFLNDSIRDKSVVTSLTNYHKTLLKEELDSLAKGHPDLKFNFYSDFKSVRVAIEGPRSKDFETALAKAIERANQRFFASPDLKDVLREEDLTGDWFRSGIGETADQANAAARYSRRSSQVKMENFSNPSLRRELGESLQTTEQLRQGLLKSLGGSNATVQTANGVQVLDRAALDIARKYEKPEEIEKALKIHYALTELPKGTGDLLLKYAEEVDAFSPGIHVAQRRFASLDEAAQGGVSVDFVGMGARNLQATSAALAQAKNLEDALVLARKSEQDVTQGFHQQRAMVETEMDQVLGRRQSMTTSCSGDDCIGIAKVPLTERERKEFVRRLAHQGEPSSYRVAFLSEGVTDTTARSQLVTHGESLEKLLRKRLAGDIDPRRLQGLLFAIDMKGKVTGEGAIQLLVAKGPTLKLTREEKKALESALQESIEKLNTDLQLSHIPARYQADKVHLID